MLAVNVKEGKLYLNDEVKQTVVDKKPYAQLLKSSVTPIAKGSFKAGMRPALRCVYMFQIYVCMRDFHVCSIDVYMLLPTSFRDFQFHLPLLGRSGEQGGRRSCG